VTTITTHMPRIEFFVRLLVRLQATLSILSLLLAIHGCGGHDASDQCEADMAYRGSFAPPVADALRTASRPLRPRIPLPVADTSELDQAFARALEGNSSVEATASVILDEGGFWSAGSKNRFWWGSVGKTFTAMLVLQLVQQGKLALSTRVDDFAPYVPHGDSMTIRHLLSHTSGLYNFTRAPTYQHESIYRRHETLIAFALLQGSEWCPGMNWGYSNTGYLLLGKIIEDVTGQPFDDVLNSYIRGRLAPTSLAALSPGPAPSDVVLPSREGPAPSITTPFAAGNVVGSSFDMALAWKHFLSGGLITNDQVAIMFEPLYPTDEPGRAYGLGVMVYQGTAVDGDIWLGHQGSIDGARSFVCWSSRHGATVAVAVTGGGDARAIATALLDTLPPAGYMSREKQ